MATPSNPSTAVTVGAFTIDAGVLSGPAAYLGSDSYRACMARIYAGTNVVFNFGARERAASIETLVLVAVQTDFASWSGLQSFGVRS